MRSLSVAVAMLLALPARGDEAAAPPPPASTTAPAPAASAPPGEPASSAPPSPAATPPTGGATTPAPAPATAAPGKRSRRAALREEADLDAEADVAGEEEPEPPPERSFLQPRTDSWKRPTRIAGWVALGAAGALALSAVGTLGAHGYYAGRWNDDSRCLVAGRYRFSTCADDYNQATRLQTLGVQLAVTAGVLGVTAAVLLLASRPAPPPKKSRRRSVSCLPDPLSVGVACAGVF